MTVSQTYLGYAQVADLLGVLPGTVRSYHNQGRMPEPDARVGKVPGWIPATIESWVASRPGQGTRTDRLRSNRTSEKDTQ